MAYTEFYCQNGGSNLNAGSTTNNTAAYTSTSGNWVSGTGVFTPTDSSNPSSTVNVGDFASVYANGSTLTNFIGRITQVQNATNGTITVSTTAYAGTIPSTASGSRSIKVGGAWAGPSGATGFPFVLSTPTQLWRQATNANGDAVRLNVRNDQTYSMTAGLDFDNAGWINGFSPGSVVIQGYSSSPADGGKAIFTSNVNTLPFSYGRASWGVNMADLIFAGTGTSNANHLFQLSNSTLESIFRRCVFHGARGSGFACFNTNGANLIECEAYDCNKSTTVNFAGFYQGNTGRLILINCYSHDHTSSNTNGFGVVNSSVPSMVLINCIAANCAANGFYNPIANIGSVVAIGCNFYNNTGDGIKLAGTTASGFAYIANNNFTKNAGKAINAAAGTQMGVLLNNGRGAGTEANGSSDSLGSIENTGTDVTYASNASPYKAGSTGDFSTTLAAAQGAGRGAFTETDGTNTGTVGYPDIGAAQHYDTQKASTFGG